MSEIEQGSDAWRQLRIGKVTASRVADVVAKTKSGPSASRANYMAELIAERLTGVPGERFTNTAMQWGTDHEADARRAYEFYHDFEVEQVAFVDHPTIPMTGASPDGIIKPTTIMGDKTIINGLVEIKCPNTATHLDTLLGQSAPGKYITQMQWQMACTATDFCDFVSFDPRLPESMRLFVFRVQRDFKLIAELEHEVRKFLGELDEKVSLLRSKYEPSP
jgi:putative phage-type endonuclease